LSDAGNASKGVRTASPDTLLTIVQESQEMLIGIRLATSALHRQKAVCEICPALIACLADVLDT
jgi:hypothetical protein